MVVYCVLVAIQESGRMNWKTLIFSLLLVSWFHALHGEDLELSPDEVQKIEKALSDDSQDLLDGEEKQDTLIGDSLANVLTDDQEDIEDKITNKNERNDDKELEDGNMADENEEGEDEEENDSDKKTGIEVPSKSKIDNDEFDVDDDTPGSVRNVPHKVGKGKQLSYLKRIPYQSRWWRLSVDIKPFGVSKGWSNVLYIRSGNRKLRTAIWFHDWNTKLRICGLIHHHKKCVDTPLLPTTKYTNIKVAQMKQGKTRNYIYTVYVCDLKIMELRNPRPVAFRDLDVYAGAPWAIPAKAFIKNVIFETDNFPKGLVHRNKLLATIPIQERSWRLSFKVRPLETVPGWGSLIHLTTGGNFGVFGYRIPGVWFNRGATSLHICSAINHNHNQCINTYHLPLGTSANVVIEQKPIGGYEYLFFGLINGRKVFSLKNQNARIFRDVRMYSGDPWHTPAHATVNGLVFTNIPLPAYLIQRNKIIDVIPLQTPYYEISFNIKPERSAHKLGSVLHFTIGGNHGRIGDRIPGIWLDNFGRKLLICAAIKGNPNYCWRATSSLPTNSFTKLSITQKLVRGKIMFQVFMNGKQSFSIENTTPYYFQNVIVYNADPWHHAARVSIQNYKFINLQKSYTWFQNLRGKQISITSGSNRRLIASSQGDLSLKQGEESSLFTVEVLSPFRVALKSPFNRYVVVTRHGKVLANRLKPEIWTDFTLVFLAQNKIAFLSHNFEYLTASLTGEIKSHGYRVGPQQIFNIAIKK